MRLPKLQLHLTTCIVLMFAAGGLLWANLTTSTPPWATKAWGWPFHLRYEIEEHENIHEVTFTDQEFQNLKPNWGVERKLDNGNLVLFDRFGETEFEPPTLDRNSWVVVRRKVVERRPTYFILLNIITALAILATTAFLCEWLLRRRRQI